MSVSSGNWLRAPHLPEIGAAEASLEGSGGEVAMLGKPHAIGAYAARRFKGGSERATMGAITAPLVHWVKRR